MTLYLVLNKNGRIIGRFKSKTKAINYMIDCWFDGIDGVTTKTVTKEEYEAMTKKEIEKNVVL